VNAQDRTAEPTLDLPLEIAHLLLIDVVGYSKLLVNEQIELLQELNQIVRGTESFRAAETRGKLIRLFMFIRTYTPRGELRLARKHQSQTFQIRAALQGIARFYTKIF